MKSVTTEAQYKQYFSDSFQGMNSLIGDVLSPIFGEFTPTTDSKGVDYVNVYGDGGANIEHIYDYGKFYTDNTDVSVFEVVLSERCHISRARKGIKETVSRITDKYSGAFIVFHYPDGSANAEAQIWRLSWLKRLDVRRNDSPAKRYTYLCGPSYSCRTIAQRFVTLYKEENKTLNSITKAFDAEALSEEFFKEYKVLYDDIVQWITGQRVIREGRQWKEEGSFGAGNGKDICDDFLKEFENIESQEEKEKQASKAIRDYVKKMLGRLVFIQFLQKKGYLGIDGKTTQNFLLDLFNCIADEQKDNFIDTALEQVVYLLLNSDDRKPGSEVINNHTLEVPFLNGGLFERDKWDEKNVKLPKEFFHNEQYVDEKRDFRDTELRPKDKFLTQCGILDLFNHYNFTIDENDPNDAEVGVDPEMLGKIFENLLEDNKEKGAFYTPKEIVQYMCRESLIAYLQTGIEDEGTKDAIRQFVTTQEIGEKLPKDIDQKLQEVKICDPAIGSGAFPMGLLNLLVALREKLEPANNRCKLKKDIIQKNIYGVDIERGAIDIARLRFWLSIMVDEDSPTPLPNFDYKFMQGNSLLEQYKGIDLSTLSSGEKVSMQTDIFQNNLKQFQSQLHSLIELYYNTDNHKEKRRLKKEIQDNVNNQMKESGVNVNFTELGIDVAGNDQFFLWHTWFQDVFENGKFDIVIGNPPYGANIDNLITTYEAVFPNTSYGYRDIYKYFFDFSLRIINNNNGILSLITPNTFLRQPRYKDLRKVLLNTHLLKILNLGENVFSEAVVPVAVTLLKNEKNCSCVDYVDLTRVLTKDNIFLILGKIDYENIKQTDWNTSPNHIFIEKSSERIVKTIELDKIVNFKDAGINYQRVNVGLSQKGKSDLSKRLLYEGVRENENDHEYWKGTDINQYYISPHTNRYCRTSIQLANNERVILNKDYFSIHPKLIWRQTASYPVCTVDNKGIWFGRSIQAGLIKMDYQQKLSYEYLCGLLNSRYIRYLYENNVREGGRVFPQVKLEHLKPLPVVIDNMTIQQKIENKVKELLKNKMVNQSANTDAIIESDIDRLVCHLYNLTYDEVMVIYENENPPFSREQYENENE